MRTFIREGRNMEYEEVMNLIVEAISDDVLQELDVQELKDFLKRLLEWYHTQVSDWVKNIKAPNIMEKNKVLAKGRMLLEEGQKNKELLIKFIDDELIIEMEKSLEAIRSTNKVLNL